MTDVRDCFPDYLFLFGCAKQTKSIIIMTTESLQLHLSTYSICLNYFSITLSIHIKICFCLLSTEFDTFSMHFKLFQDNCRNNKVFYNISSTAGVIPDTPLWSPLSTPEWVVSASVSHSWVFRHTAYPQTPNMDSEHLVVATDTTRTPASDTILLCYYTSNLSTHSTIIA